MLETFLMNKSELNFQWWKIACERNPNPVCFVDVDNKFIFANKSFCELVGWSESDLKEKSWFEITKNEDIGGDSSEVSAIKNGLKTEYYLEKTYIRKDKKEIDVCIYVHRYPEFGDHEGYIVFARKLSSEEFENLKDKFYDLHKTVLLLQQNAVSSEYLSNEIKLLGLKLEQQKELINMTHRPSINIGDKTRSGRDSIKNDSKVIIAVSAIIIIGIICVTALFLGGVLNIDIGNYGVEVNK